ncbi:MAG: 50S ribosomal protein L4 [Verrucomicrobia bacterium]|nr:50S ribosomal protein L4 [Verrucomicrobiota bacterium]
MKLPVHDSNGAAQGELEVKFPLVEKDKGAQAVHDYIVAYNAAQRQGNACTKTMGEVAGTGKKPWRQKGTGRARAGSFASPLWRGGGVTFGPKPRDYRKQVTKTVRALALRKAMTERLSAGDVIVVDDLKLTTHRTKEFLALRARLKIEGTSLFVTLGVDRNLLAGSGNVQGVDVTTSDILNTYDVLKPDKLVFTRSAFEAVDQRIIAAKS